MRHTLCVRICMNKHDRVVEIRIQAADQLNHLACVTPYPSSLHPVYYPSQVRSWFCEAQIPFRHSPCSRRLQHRGTKERRRRTSKGEATPWKEKMLKLGIEPKTFALLARRSNQLSYSSTGLRFLPTPFVRLTFHYCSIVTHSKHMLL